ncbi:hypothetical protein GCM10027093_29640 [Paraburkholderia jirisanensis]
MRQTIDVDIALAPRPDGMPLQRWLHGELRAAIVSGRLAPGVRLPATRELATRLRLSRGTVLGVFAQLTAEGYIEGAVGRGSFVAAELPDSRLEAPPRVGHGERGSDMSAAQARERWAGTGPSAAVRDAELGSGLYADPVLDRCAAQEVLPQEFSSLGRGAAGARDANGAAPANATVGLSARGKLLARSAFALDGRPLPARAFRAGQPDLDAFPFALWARIAARRTRLLHRSMLADGGACGYWPLREAIAAHVRMARGIACSAAQIVIVASVQQVLDLCARLLLDPGDNVWLEDPGYPGARLVFEAAGARIVGVPVDSGGMDVAAGIARAPSAKLAYVTAGRHAPLGPPLAPERRLALLGWARAHGAFVIEDDYDSEYRFEGRPLAALKSLDDSGRVIYCGTFSKLLFPALRIAYAVLPERLVEPFSAALSLTSRHVPLDPQATLHQFIAEGHFGRHARKMRLLYGERAAALREAASRHLAGMLEVPPIVAGLDAPAWLPPGTDDARLAERAALAGIETRPLSAYAVQRAAPAGLVLGFACVEVAQIEAGVRGLAQVLGSIRGNSERSAKSG